MINKKGQQLIEYIVVLTILIVVFLTFTQKGGYFQEAIKTTYNTTSNLLLNAADIIFN